MHSSTVYFRLCFHNTRAQGRLEELLNMRANLHVMLSTTTIAQMLLES